MASPHGVLALLMLFLSLHHAMAIPSVPVESFSLADIDNQKSESIMEMLAALEGKGIIVIREIPEYAALRQRYLSTAASCVASHASSAGVQSATLRDGTTRATISTKSQFNNPALAQSAVEKHCPQYLPILRAFSELLNIVAAKLAVAIDSALGSSPSRIKQAQSLEKITTTAHHLDHFHSYSSPRSATTKPTDKEDGDAKDAVLSLDLHTDNGLMILMTKPAFYTTDDTGRIRFVPQEAMESGPTASGGLVIKQPHQPHAVQPVLLDDELVVMIGEGYRSWMYSNLDFKAVLHGMQMPRFSPAYGQVSRAWFGKMVLLPKDQQIQHIGMTYGEYTDRATEYVVGSKGSESFSAVACPPHSKLVASDKSCALKLYEPSADSRASRKECMDMCNTHSDECEELCQYVATIPSGGVDCWMLCLPNDECASDEVAKCDPSGAQRTVCVASKSL